MSVRVCECASKLPTSNLRAPSQTTNPNNIMALPKLCRSCFTLLRNARDRNQLIETLYQSGIPNTLIGYIVDSSQVGQLTTGNIYCHQKQAECIFPTTETGYLTRNKLKSMR